MPFNVAGVFQYHKPFGTQAERYSQLREKAKELAELIEASCPESREKALAFTNLQQSVMWANAAIGINEVEPPAERVEF
jgi:hypothetical protein